MHRVACGSNCYSRLGVELGQESLSKGRGLCDLNFLPSLEERPLRPFHQFVQVEDCRAEGGGTSHEQSNIKKCGVQLLVIKKH